MASSRGRTSDQPSDDAEVTTIDATEGILLWITPTGAHREIVQSSLASPTNGSVACGHCGSSAWLETVVREHRRCGYVAFDGMVGSDGMRHACPKCETMDGADFPAVATIWTCRTCGHPTDEAE